MADLKESKILVIVESPSKGEHIQEYLKKGGYKYAKVMASKGHIMELANGGTYFNSGITPEKDFEMNLQVDADKTGLVKGLKAAADAADYVFLMSDPDREGEVISWSLAKFLKLPKGKTYRAFTHEITPKAVINAIEHPTQVNDDLVDAGLSRMTLDKMIGFRLSPIARTYIGAKSIGRCQSAGLKIIVDREKEIRSFVPEKYWDIYLTFSKNKAEFKAKYIGTAAKQIDHVKTAAGVKAIMAACSGDYEIKSIEQHTKQESPKPPFSTADYQQEAASKLGLSVKDAMGVAQKLFEAGKITYHRTDDTDISPEFIPTLKGYIESEYGKKAWNAPRKGKKQENAQEGHECLRITDPGLTPEMFAKSNPNPLQQKAYKIIWQRTIASALPNAVISETDYVIDNGGHLFLLKSNEVIDEGYRKVYSYKDDDADDESAVKETFKQGEKLKNAALEDVSKETQPKPRFKEATFIKELKKLGIGRPSTYATITETVLSQTRGYCELDSKKCMVPTERGMQLIDFTDRAFPDIINIEYTKEMEESLDKIANGKIKKKQYLTEFYDGVENAIKSNKEISKAAGGDEVPNCPNCGKPMILRRSKYGKLFYGCSNYPKCTGIVNVK